MIDYEVLDCLKIHADENRTCEGCKYDGVEYCSFKLAKDAAAMIETLLKKGSVT